MIISWILFVLTLLLGYALGRLSVTPEYIEKIQEKIKTLTEDKPKPGVVNPLSEEELAEKKDPQKAGNKAAFDKFFRDNPPPTP